MQREPLLGMKSASLAPGNTQRRTQSGAELMLNQVGQALQHDRALRCSLQRMQGCRTEAGDRLFSRHLTALASCSQDLPSEARRLRDEGAEGGGCGGGLRQETPDAIISSSPWPIPIRPPLRFSSSFSPAKDEKERLSF